MLAEEKRSTPPLTAAQRKFVHTAFVVEIFAFLIALIVFLIIIVSVLERINDNLGITERAAASVDRSADSLPGLVHSITGSLRTIHQQVQPISGQLEQINAGLTATAGGLSTAESNLSAINGALSHTETGLIAALGFADRVKNGSIVDKGELATVVGQGDTAIALLSGVHTDTGNIERLATMINGHLASINSTLP